MPFAKRLKTEKYSTRISQILTRLRSYWEVNATSAKQSASWTSRGLYFQRKQFVWMYIFPLRTYILIYQLITASRDVLVNENDRCRPWRHPRNWYPNLTKKCDVNVTRRTSGVILCSSREALVALVGDIQCHRRLWFQTEGPNTFVCNRETSERHRIYTPFSRQVTGGARIVMSDCGRSRYKMHGC